MFNKEFPLEYEFIAATRFFQDGTQNIYHCRYLQDTTNFIFFSTSGYYYCCPRAIIQINEAWVENYYTMKLKLYIVKACDHP